MYVCVQLSRARPPSFGIFHITGRGMHQQIPCGQAFSFALNSMIVLLGVNCALVVGWPSTWLSISAAATYLLGLLICWTDSSFPAVGGISYWSEEAVVHWPYGKLARVPFLRRKCSDATFVFTPVCSLCYAYLHTHIHTDEPSFSHTHTQHAHAHTCAGHNYANLVSG